MLTRNLTPFQFGSKPTSTRRGRLEMTVVVRGTFALEPDQPLRAIEGLDAGFLTGETLHDEDDPASEAVYPGDFADVKLNAEVMLRATCHTPGGSALPECPVRVSLGAWSKALMVYGPRTWSGGLLGSLSKPAPFTRMPITWANAFGGRGFAANPVGKGIEGPEAPHVIAPGEVYTSPSDRPAPGGFGPLNSTWAQRAGRAGAQYGRAWRETRAPYPAEDFDWTSLHAAPADQQLKGFLRGDEDLTLQNLHPRAPRWTVKLPALRVRAFVRDDRGEFREVALRLDTVFADVDAGKLYLTWRGLDGVRTDDLSDVTTMLVASEPLGVEPRESAQYRDALVAFERDPTGLGAEAPPAPADATLLTPRSHKPGYLPPVPPPPTEISAHEVEQAGPGARLAGRDLSGQDFSGRDLSGADLSEAVLSGARLRGTKLRGANLRGAVLYQADVSGADLSGADLTQCNGAKLIAAGANLTDAVLELAYLEEADLSNAVLVRARGDHAFLERARLDGADGSRAELPNAEMSGASLLRSKWLEAKLSSGRFIAVRAGEADFSRAHLSGSSFQQAVLRRARFVEARADGSFWGGADLDEADLSHASLAGAHLSGVSAPRADFSASDLSGARMDRATVEDALFVRANLLRVNLCKARISRARFTGANLYDAKLLQAVGAQCDFTDANLRRSTLDRSE